MFLSLSQPSIMLLSSLGSFCSLLSLGTLAHPSHTPPPSAQQLPGIQLHWASPGAAVKGPCVRLKPAVTGLRGCLAIAELGLAGHTDFPKPSYFLSLCHPIPAAWPLPGHNPATQLRLLPGSRPGLGGGETVLGRTGQSSASSGPLLPRHTDTQTLTFIPLPIDLYKLIGLGRQPSQQTRC